MKELFLQYFPGIAEMANIHPLLVHFPIALLTGFIVSELLSVVSGSKDLRIAGKWMLYFGTLGALAAAAVGLLGAEGVFHEGEVHEQMSRHRDYGLNVVALSLFLCAWRLTEGRDLLGLSRIIQNALGVLILVNLMLGADLGGGMVYKYGVAVQAVPREEMSEMGSHEHGGGIGSEIMEWVHGFVEEERVIRKHSH
ncbi:MAG: DUF2231 domain-containing protein [Methylococcaceae bacterium]|nr:DUF2231 domain-containing protein [Methylococcaceae bacterium]